MPEAPFALILPTIPKMHLYEKKGTSGHRKCIEGISACLEYTNVCTYICSRGSIIKILQRWIYDPLIIFRRSGGSASHCRFVILARLMLFGRT